MQSIVIYYQHTQKEPIISLSTQMSLDVIGCSQMSLRNLTSLHVNRLLIRLAIFLSHTYTV